MFYNCVNVVLTQNPSWLGERSPQWYVGLSCFCTELLVESLLCLCVCILLVQCNGESKYLLSNLFLVI